MTTKTPGSGQKRLKQSTLLSFFSKQPHSPSPAARKPIKELKNGTKTLPKGISKEVKKPTNKLLFVGMDEEESDVSGFVTANDSINAPDVVEKPAEGRTETEKGSRSSKQPDIEEDGEKTLLNVNMPNNKRESSAVEDGESTLSSSARRTKGSVSYAEVSDESDTEATPNVPRKRRRMQTEVDDDEDEYVPDKKESEADVLMDDEDDDLLELAETSSPKLVKRAAKRTPSRSPGNLFNKSSVDRVPSPPKHQKFNKQNEERYHWLVELRDASGRPVTDPQYDPRTLYVPPSAWSKFTPFEKQYWEIKSKMWDCIVFFKKGKFFELYEKDALLGNHLFDLKIAGGGRANMQLAGIPEMSFDYWASQFIQHGYKVAKVDQRESMLAKEMREGSKGIVKRELQCVLTSGTLTDGNMLQSDLATYCLAVREEPGNFYAMQEESNSAAGTAKRLFGVSFIDAATGELNMIEFEDDDECTKLDTIMSQVNPKEVIMEKDNLSNLAHKIVKFNAAPQAIFNYIKPDTEFYGYERTYDELTSSDSKYFADITQWPAVLRKYYEQGKRIGFSAFGGLLYYLQWLKLDESLLTMGNIKEYNPTKFKNSLIMDGVTLQNLEIFSNSFDGSDKGTLFKLFNRAITPMGKRMMKNWLMHPLLQKDKINERLDTVEALLSDSNLRDVLETAFAKLPDLERLLSRVHSRNLKVKDFDKTIQGFETITELLEALSSHNLNGSLLNYVSNIPESLVADVQSWSNAFDRTKAVDEGVLIPQKGVEQDFDESLDRIRQLEEQLEDLLNTYKKQFKCSTLQYKDCGKEIYTVEVPVSIANKIPSSWVQMAANKTAKRYYSDEVRALARSVAEARELHKVLEEELKDRLCKKFDMHYGTSWMPTVRIIASIDCLLALVRTSESLGQLSCRPQLVDEIDSKTGAPLNGFLKFKSLRHPCFNLGTTSAKDFIPNDVELGKDYPQLGLLTGANAAGKSTVLRMTCIAVIMAQMGCYVPCESAILTPVDRIMTRLGANDNIMQGKSTFFVELSETKKILDLATNRSLLVVDELGRGGSSSDGFAIAESVLHHVATHIQSLGFFATHYASLGQCFRGHPQVRPLKMSILVDEKAKNVTFLYKLIDGQSEGSFGMHVASMCGISKEIVQNAEKAAENMEHTSNLVKQKIAASSSHHENVSSLSLGVESDFVRLVFGDGLKNTKLGTGENVQIYDTNIKRNVLMSLFSMIESVDR